MSRLRATAVLLIAMILVLSSHMLSVAPAQAAGLTFGSSLSSPATLGNTSLIGGMSGTTPQTSSAVSSNSGSISPQSYSSDFNLLAPGGITPQQPSTSWNTCSLGSASLDTLYLIGVVLAQGAALIAADSAAADIKLPFFGTLLQGVIDFLHSLLSYWLLAVIFGVISSLVVWIAGGLLQVALTMNQNLLTGNAVVGMVYSFSLSLANIAIVLAFIIVGFGTMLRLEKVGVRNLPHIIIAALLVNFSLLIAGLIMNIGTALTKSMADSVCNGSFVYVFNISTIYVSLQSALSASNWIVGIIASFGVVVLAAVLTFIGAITLLAVAVFMIARFVVLTVLLGIAPVAWLSFMIPDIGIPELGGNTFYGWWGKFFKLVFFGPVMLFFLILSGAMISWFHDSGPGGGATMMAQAGPLSALGQMAALVVIMTLGLYMALKTGGVISTVALGAASIGGAGIIGLTNRMQKSAGRAAERLKGEDKENAGTMDRFVHRRKIGILQGLNKASIGPKELDQMLLGHVGVSTAKAPEFLGVTGAEKRAADKAAALKNSSTGSLKYDLARPTISTQHKGELIQELANRGQLPVHDPTIITEESKAAVEAAGGNWGSVEKGMGMSLGLRRSFEAAEAATAARDEAVKSKIDPNRLGELGGFDRAAEFAVAARDEAVKSKADPARISELSAAADAAVSARDKARIDMALPEYKNNDAEWAKIKELDKVVDTASGAAVDKAGEFFDDMSNKDYSKLPVNNLFGAHDANKPFAGLSENSMNRYRGVLVSGMLKKPGTLNKAAPEIKGKNFDRFNHSVLDRAVANPIIKNGELNYDEINKLRVKQREGLVAQHKNIMEKARAGLTKESLAELADKHAKELNVEDSKSPIDVITDALEKERPGVYKALSKTLAIHETGMPYTPPGGNEEKAG